jgi:hypothetical protein
MGFINSMQSSGNCAIIAGSFADNLIPQRGEGYTVTVSSGAFTITLDRQYDGFISCVATVMNPDMASGESLAPVIVSHSVAADTDGGTIVIKLIDDAGNIQTSLAANLEVNFIAILKEDT